MGKTHNLRRGSYHDWMDWLQLFNEYSAIFKSSDKSQSDKVNLALGKPVTASASQSDNTAAHGNDGKDSTRWCADDDKPGHWWQVDLQEACNLGGCYIRWQFGDQVYQYKLEGSADGKSWTLLVDETEIHRSPATSK